MFYLLMAAGIVLCVLVIITSVCGESPNPANRRAKDPWIFTDHEREARRRTLTCQQRRTR